MNDIDKLTLAEKIRLYAEGDENTGFPPHGFDFTREDTNKMLKALRDSNLYRAEKIERILRGDKK